MALLKDKKIGGAGFPNAAELTRITYDFSKDTGAVAFYEVFEAQNDCMVFLKCMSVKTAVTSGGSLTLDLGKGSAGAEMISAKAVAAMTLDSLHVGAAPVKLAAGEKISMNIKVAAATAGYLEFVLEVVRY